MGAEAEDTTGDAAAPGAAVDPYDLRIDEQVSTFLELQHRLTFFVITAAVGSLGFTLSLAGARGLPIGPGPVSLGLAGGAALAALLSAGAALRALSADIASFRLHLQYRYQRRTFAALSAAEQAGWDRVTRRAARNRRAAFCLLVLTVTLQAVFLLLGLQAKEGTAMHHFGEDSTRVVATETGFDLVFTNTATGQVITMHLPREGVLSRARPGEELTLDDATGLAMTVAHLLRQAL